MFFKLEFKPGVGGGFLTRRAFASHATDSSGSNVQVQSPEKFLKKYGVWDVGRADPRGSERLGEGIVVIDCDNSQATTLASWRGRAVSAATRTS